MAGKSESVDGRGEMNVPALMLCLKRERLTQNWSGSFLWVT